MRTSCFLLCIILMVALKVLAEEESIITSKTSAYSFDDSSLTPDQNVVISMAFKSFLHTDGDTVN